LIHEGACDETDFERLCRHQYQLMNAVALILSAICGYDGTIHLFSYHEGMRVTTVKAAGAE
jgi:hypothetical protein